MNLPFQVPTIPALPALADVPIRFLWPVALWGLLLVPIALAAYLVAQRGRRRHAARFGNPHLLPNLVPSAPGWRRHLPVAFYLLALIGLLTGLARPQTVMAVPREEATVVMVMDTSFSMGAVDVQPDRLSAAKAAANRFLDALPAPLQVALVSFSNGAQLRTAPTTDRSSVHLALDTLRPDGATAMGDAIALSVGVAESALGAGTAGTPAATPTPRGSSATSPASPAQRPAAVLLLSDGSNTAGQRQPLEAAARAQQLGIPIYTIALGTAAGTIESPDAPGTGQRMSVPPDEQTLQQVAQLTGGKFFKAPTAADLQAVYQDLGSRVGYAEEQQEVTYAFAAAGAALLAVGATLALLWFNRFP